MRKIQVFLRPDQVAALKAMSERTAQTRSDLIRKGVDLVIEQAQGRQEDWREATRAIAGLWRDRSDIDDLMRYCRVAPRQRFQFVYDRTRRFRDV